MCSGSLRQSKRQSAAINIGEYFAAAICGTLQRQSSHLQRQTSASAAAVSRQQRQFSLSLRQSHLDSNISSTSSPAAHAFIVVYGVDHPNNLARAAGVCRTFNTMVTPTVNQGPWRKLLPHLKNLPQPFQLPTLSSWSSSTCRQTTFLSLPPSTATDTSRQILLGLLHYHCCTVAQLTRLEIYGTCSTVDICLFFEIILLPPHVAKYCGDSLRQCVCGKNEPALGTKWTPEEVNIPVNTSSFVQPRTNIDVLGDDGLQRESPNGKRRHNHLIG
ncbi:hypothetical protein C8R45DRAFT_930565 [Mycena sanguinolenta]|nr:hypothetical protein C8R45DRAFT_930565 [Mycena sanguinolenta]